MQGEWGRMHQLLSANLECQQLWEIPDRYLRGTPRWREPAGLLTPGPPLIETDTGPADAVFKITRNIYDRTVSPDLPLNERANTRGNHYKLQNHTFHYDLRKHFFLHAL